MVVTDWFVSNGNTYDLLLVVVCTFLRRKADIRNWCPHGLFKPVLQKQVRGTISQPLILNPHYLCIFIYDANDGRHSTTTFVAAERSLNAGRSL